MAKTPKDPQAVEFQLRPGVAPFGPEGWRGVDTESDPGSLLPNQLQRGDNIRLRGKNIRTRDGLLQYIDFGLGPSLSGTTDNVITWLHEAPCDNPRVRLWASVLAAVSCGAGTGSAIFHYDPSEDPSLQLYSFTLTAANYYTPLGRFGDQLFVGDRTMLRTVTTITPHPHVSSDALLFSPPNSPVVIFAGYTIRCLQEFDSKLFIGLENLADPALSKIVVWNGLSVQDDLTGIRPPLAMGLYQDKLVVGFDATAANIRWRAAGAIPGTWTTVALAGFACSPHGNAMQEYRQYLFIASGNGDIFRFDGTAITLVRTIAAAAVDTYGITSLCLLRGLLYYGWNTDLGTGRLSRIGRHDPDSTAANEWVDTYKDVSTPQPTFIQLTAMASYNEQIVIGGANLKMLATAVDDVQGTLVSVQTTFYTGDSVKQFVRFP